jgi:hypothetical protein
LIARNNEGNKMVKISVASRTVYANIWLHLRSNLQSRDIEITSTWIDESGEGQTKSYEELSARCIEEIRRSDLFILYCKPGDLLKGALIEAGAALAFNIPVRCIGSCESLSRVFIKHRRWATFNNFESALKDLVEIKDNSSHIYLKQRQFDPEQQKHLSWQQCQHCGCSFHSGKYWFGGYQSLIEPPCNSMGKMDLDWLVNSNEI